ncbi:MAG: alginate export family protein [Planctomycetales bacterium]
MHPTAVHFTIRILWLTALVVGGWSASLAAQNPGGESPDGTEANRATFEEPLPDELAQSTASPSPATGAGSAGSSPEYPGAAPAPAKPAKGGKKPPVQPWKGVFFDNDFSYKKNPDHDWLLGENLKDIPFGGLFDWLDDPTTLSTGGEVRYRLMDEANRLRAVPPGVKNLAVYNLWRYRQYVDLKVGDSFRVYAELLEADMFDNPLAVTGIDVNQWDLQNLFFDLKLLEIDDRPLYLRYGRQELLYGSQRLLSPLDWANIRRNWQGFKFFTKGPDWDLDAWSTYPVNTASFGNGQVLLNDGTFDSPNLNHNFSGAWFTYKGVKDQTWDLYYFWDWNRELISPHFAGGNRQTIATRWLRSFPVTDFGEVDRTWLAEVEGGYQYGDDFGRRVNAGFCTTGVGHQWTGLRWQPTLWLYYDWASGSRNYNGRSTQTFSQQYGLTHAFLGQIDNIARQNITDINGKFSVTPVKQLNLEAQYHWFNLQNPHDVLYIITGQPFGKPNTGRHVGQEVDAVATYTYSPNFSVQFGYFYFWYGDFVQNNSPRGNAYMFYVQPTLRF